jgi:ferredoxin
MRKYEIVVDPSLCSGYGACVDAARDLFQLDRGGIARAVVTHTDDPAALEAAAACPMEAIFVTRARAKRMRPLQPDARSDSAWSRPSLARHVRVEHWTSAAGQAGAVASAITGEPAPYDESPYFWSDQFGLRLQHVGHGESWDSVVLDGDKDEFTARYLDADGRLLSALAANRASQLRALRLELAA